MRSKILAANWKMYGSRLFVKTLLEKLKQQIKKENGREAVIFPSYPFLDLTERLLQGSAISWGAQSMASEEEGAFTGEVSPSMLIDFKCRYVLIGHSERRQFFGETDQFISKKFNLAQTFNLCPLLCVGETLAQHKENQTKAVVKAQIHQALAKVTVPLKDFIIAYEPLWAIGTGLTPKPEEIQKIHAEIREELANYGQVLAEKSRILYGGSLQAANAQEIFSMPDVDGGLVGRASLQVKEFLTIYQRLGQSF